MKDLNVIIYKNVNVKLDSMSMAARRWEEEGSTSGWGGFLIFSPYIKGINMLLLME